MPVPMPINSNPDSTSSTQSSTAAQTHQSSNANGANQSVASSAHTQQQSGKTEQELEAERLYEERMEEEYAKREGGA